MEASRSLPLETEPRPLLKLVAEQVPTQAAVAADPEAAGSVALERCVASTVLHGESPPGASYKPISPLEAFRLIRMNDTQLFERKATGHQHARELLIKRYLPFARKLAGKYANANMSQADLEQVASLGVVKAVDRFDNREGVAFLGYAFPVVAGEIKHHFRDMSWGVHVPRSLQERNLAVQKARVQLEESTQEASLEQIAAKLDIQESKVVEAWLAGERGLLVDSLDRPVSDPAASATVVLGDRIGSRHSQETVAYLQLCRRIDKRLEPFPEKQRTIFWMSLLGDFRQVDIAEALGTTQKEVSRILRKIFKHLQATGSAAEL